MATATVFSQRQNNPMVVSGISTIDINETASLAIPCHGRAKVILGIPSEFTGTSLTFTVQAFPPADPAAPTADPPFRQLRDEAGNIVTATVAANRTLEIPELGGCYAFTIVSGSTEAAARAIEVSCVGPYPSSSGTNNLTVEGGSIVVSSLTAFPGTASVNAEQEELSTNAEAAFAARATRRFGIIQNLDTAITVYVGFDNTVGPTTGVALLAGQWMVWASTAAVWMEAASGTPTAAFIEYYG